VVNLACVEGRLIADTERGLAFASQRMTKVQPARQSRRHLPIPRSHVPHRIQRFRDKRAASVRSARQLGGARNGDS
jgi:hypothetical protein